MWTSVDFFCKILSFAILPANSSFRFVHPLNWLVWAFTLDSLRKQGNAYHVVPRIARSFSASRRNSSASVPLMTDLGGNDLLKAEAPWFQKQRLSLNNIGYL